MLTFLFDLLSFLPLSISLSPPPPPPPLDVALSFNGMALSNNSELLLSDFEPSNETGGALICSTNYRPCCANVRNRYGDWYYPNGTEVPNMASGWEFYRNRGDDGTVRLFRRNNDTIPSGTFYCEIPLDTPQNLSRLNIRCT